MAGSALVVVAARLAEAPPPRAAGPPRPASRTTSSSSSRWCARPPDEQVVRHPLLARYVRQDARASYRRTLRRPFASIILQARCAGPTVSAGHLVRPASGHRLATSAPGAGVRLRTEVLAAPGPLAEGRGLQRVAPPSARQQSALRSLHPPRTPRRPRLLGDRRLSSPIRAKYPFGVRPSPVTRRAGRQGSVRRRRTARRSPRTPSAP